MKYLFGLLLLSQPVFGVKLMKQESSPLGTFTQGFELTEKKAEYARTSNAFDDTPDFRIGAFEIEAAKTRVIQKKLEELEIKISAADAVLRKEQNMSFNDVAGPPGHRQVFYLGDFMVPPGSKQYGEIESLFRELKALGWKQVSGYELSKDLSKVTEFSSGKVKRTQDYPKYSFCDRSTKICTYTGGGRVLVKDL